MLTSVCVNQCDQIWRFIALWATFQSHWQQLFCPNCPHILGNFVTQHLPTIGAISKTVLLHFRLSRYLTKSMDLHIYVSFDQKSVNMFDMVWNQLKIYLAIGSETPAIGSSRWRLFATKTIKFLLLDGEWMPVSKLAEWLLLRCTLYIHCSNPVHCKLLKESL